MDENRTNHLSEEGRALVEIERNLEEYINHEILQMKMEEQPVQTPVGGRNFANPEQPISTRPVRTETSAASVRPVRPETSETNARPVMKEKPPVQEVSQGDEDEFFDWDAAEPKASRTTTEARQRNMTEKAKTPKTSKSSVPPKTSLQSKSSKPSKAPVPPQAPKKKKHLPIFVRFLITLAVFAGILLGLWYMAVNSVYKNMQYEEVASVKGDQLKEDGVTNILLIGTDARDGVDGSRSDAMILLSISEKTQTIYLTSLLRDMYVDIPGHKGNRLNAAYAYGGAELLMETIETNLDITVNDYAIVDFMAFVKLVDAVGGVDLELSAEEKGLVNGYLNEYNEISGFPAGTGYIDANEAGMVHLGGAQSLAYCRNRYIGSDFGRTERQRKVLSQAMKKLPKAMLRNPSILTEDLLPNLTTNLTSWEAYRLSFIAPKLLTYEVKQASIPLEGTYHDATIRDMAVLEVDYEANKKFLQEELWGKNN